MKKTVENGLYVHSEAQFLEFRRVPRVLLCSSSMSPFRTPDLDHC